MPGVLTVEETNNLDLGSWPLVVHGSFVHMAVSLIPILIVYNSSSVMLSVSAILMNDLTMGMNYRT